MKKFLGVAGVIATLYMCSTALFGNATCSAPIWELSWQIWIAPITLCSIAWCLSLIISIIFKSPKKAVLTVCLESANQNSIAIGIPIMYTIINGLGGVITCQLNWVNCRILSMNMMMEFRIGVKEIMKMMIIH